MSWARPRFRRKVDLPPRFAPVIITSVLPSAARLFSERPFRSWLMLATRRTARGQQKLFVGEPAISGRQTGQFLAC